jgi:hypothetical protein
VLSSSCRSKVPRPRPLDVVSRSTRNGGARLAMAAPAAAAEKGKDIGFPGSGGEGDII